MGGLLAYNNSYGMLDALSVCLWEKKTFECIARAGNKKRKTSTRKER
jgi:hypothetical protein